MFFFISSHTFQAPSSLPLLPSPPFRHIHDHLSLCCRHIALYALDISNVLLGDAHSNTVKPVLSLYINHSRRLFEVCHNVHLVAYPLDSPCHSAAMFKK